MFTFYRSIPSRGPRSSGLESDRERHQLYFVELGVHNRTSQSRHERGILYRSPQRCNVSLFVHLRNSSIDVGVSSSTALTTTTININTSAGTMTVPKTGSLTLNGRESKILVTDFVFGESKSKILYSTAEVMTWTT